MGDGEGIGSLWNFKGGGSKFGIHGKGQIAVGPPLNNIDIKKVIEILY